MFLRKRKKSARKSATAKRKEPIVFVGPEKTVAKKTSEPKIAKGNPSYKLPSPSLLREGERSQKLDEDELKDRARAIEAKCLEFDVQGRVTQINPGPVVTTFEFKPEAGIKYSRIIGLTEDLCLALQAESILIERIPGKSTIGIEVPNIIAANHCAAGDYRGSGVHEFPEQTNAGDGPRFARADSRYRSGGHAALADRWLDGHRQKRVHQLADDVHPL